MITNPAIDVLQRELDGTSHQIDELADSLRAAKAKQKSLEDALSVLRGHPVSSQTSRTTPNGGPTLKRQILDLLTPDGMGLSPAEIADLLTKNGRETGNTSVSSTLSRMRNDGVVVKRGRKWFLPADSLDPQSAFADVDITEPPRPARTTKHSDSTGSEEANTGSSETTSGVLDLNINPIPGQDTRGNPNVDPFVIGQADPLGSE